MPTLFAQMNESTQLKVNAGFYNTACNCSMHGCVNFI